MRVRTRDPGPRRGTAMAELAILLPFLSFLFLVAVDFCRVFNATQIVEGCAEAGALYASGTARAASTTTTTDAATAAAVAEGAGLNPPLTAGNVAVTITSNTATVTVTYSFPTLTGFPGLPQTLTLTRTVTMNVAPAVGAGN